MALKKAALPTLVHVIDDDEAPRESLTFLLCSAGLNVQYSSARAFSDVLPGLTLSCVITDLRMPEMSGIELVQHLKNLKIEAPVIVITGHGDIALAVEAMKIGAVDFGSRKTLRNAMQSAPKSNADLPRYRRVNTTCFVA